MKRSEEPTYPADEKAARHCETVPSTAERVDVATVRRPAGASRPPPLTVHFVNGGEFDLQPRVPVLDRCQHRYHRVAYNLRVAVRPVRRSPRAFVDRGTVCIALCCHLGSRDLTAAWLTLLVAPLLRSLGNEGVSGDAECQQGGPNGPRAALQFHGRKDTWCRGGTAVFYTQCAILAQMQSSPQASKLMSNCYVIDKSKASSSDRHFNALPRHAQSHRLASVSSWSGSHNGATCYRFCSICLCQP